MSWNKQLNYLLGWFSRYAASREFYSAFGSLENAIYHVLKDQRKRVFVIDKKTGKIDEKGKANFEALFLSFQQLYGTLPHPQGKLSYLDLRTLDKPDAMQDVVFISRDVNYVDAWGDSNPAYAAYKVGFSYKGVIPATVNGKKRVTNCLPYAKWQIQSRKVFGMLLPIAKELETIMAAYLHNEGENRVAIAAEDIPMDFDNESQFGSQQDEPMDSET